MVIDGIVDPNRVLVGGDFQFDGLGRLVHAGRSGASQTIVVDGRPGPLAEGIVQLVTAREAFGRVAPVSTPVAFRISADGAHVIWAGFFDGAQHPVMDDEVGPEFDLIYDCRFDQDGSAVWWAERGQEVVRVTRMSSETARP